MWNPSNGSLSHLQISDYCRWMTWRTCHHLLINSIFFHRNSAVHPGNVNRVPRIQTIIWYLKGSYTRRKPRSKWRIRWFHGSWKVQTCISHCRKQNHLIIDFPLIRKSVVSDADIPKANAKNIMCDVTLKFTQWEYAKKVLHCFGLWLQCDYWVITSPCACVRVYWTSGHSANVENIW